MAESMGDLSGKKFERTPFAQSLRTQIDRIGEIAFERGGGDARLDIGEQMVEFAKTLQSKHGAAECRKYQAFAELIGSSGHGDQTVYEDFANEDSVQAFINRLETEVSTP